MLTSHLTPLNKTPTPLHTHPNQLFSTPFSLQQVWPLDRKRAQKNMMKQFLSPFLLLLFLFHLCTKISGQSSPSGPADITVVLGQAGKFTTFIGLLKSTQMDAQINDELKKKSTPGITVFAPTDSAFSDLKPGTLNSFSDQQKAALTQFHVVPTFLTVSQFQTVSNPLHTEASENTVEFPLNVVGNGTQVNMTTGLVNTTVDSTVYTDGQLAVYEIPQVLLSQGILSPQAPAPAPLPPRPKKATPLNSAAPSKSTTVSVDSSGAGGLPHYAPTTVSIGVVVLACGMVLIPMN